MTIQIGQTICHGKYRILELIGEGATARVWKAEELEFGGRLVAIKELKREQFSPLELAEFERRFQREVRVGAELFRANVGHVVRAITLDRLEETSDRLLVLEYVGGGSLADLIGQQPQGLPMERAVQIAMQVCDALAGFHGLGTGPVHRDVKPSNILLTEAGEPLLSDFGSAQLPGESGRTVGMGGLHPGTPLYMAPEQERGVGVLRPAADVFALGCVLFEMVTGRPYKHHRPGTLPSELRPDVPPWLDEAVARALQEDQWERVPSGGEFRAALDAGMLQEEAARERARREAEERARQERLAGLHEDAGAALREQRWQEAIEHCQAIAAIDPGYRDVGGLRAQAEEGLRKDREAEERERQRQAKLERLYAAVRAALEAEEWEAAVQRCEEIQRLDRGYRDVMQMRARAQARLAERRAALAQEGRQQAAAVSEQRVPDQPRPKPFPWLPVLAGVAAVVMIVSTVWGIRSCNGQPTPQVIEKVVKETVVIEVTSTPAEQPVEATATRQPPTNTPLLPTSTPRPPTATPGEPVAGATRVWDKDGAVMVYVPAGEFLMGSPEGEGYDDEHPQHTVTLDGYWIDRTEVTNEQFARFVEATGHRTTAEEEGSGHGWTGEEWTWIKGAEWRHPNGPATSIDEQMDHPVVQVSWDDAVAYCQWAGKRLPTEAEWEKAARGSDGRTYPWGYAFDGSKLNFCDTNCEFDWKDDGADDGYARTAPVGSYPAGASPYGALDMAGNVWEWVADWYDSEYYSESSATRNPTGPGSGDGRVLRGGSWDNDVNHARSANRSRIDPVNRNNNNGFRCCVSPTSSL